MYGRCWRLLASALTVTLLCVASRAEAFERQWRLSADVGYALAGFQDHTARGFGAGTHLSYGISDAFNLRASVDFSAFDLPEPGSAAFVLGGTVGAEYVIDILQWVPYLGASIGAADVIIQDAGHHPALLIEFPVGVGYQLSRAVMLGIEGRYRLLPLPSASSPSHHMLVAGTLAYTWGF